MATDDGTEPTAEDLLLAAALLRAVAVGGGTAVLVVRLDAVDVTATDLLAVLLLVAATPLLLVTGPADFSVVVRLDAGASDVRRDCAAEAAARGGS